MTSDALFSQAMHKSDLRLFSNCISLGRRTCTLSCWNASRAAQQMRMLLEGEKSLTCNTRTSWETPNINQNQWCLPYVYPQITKRPGYLGSSWVLHVYFVASFFNQPATKCNQTPVLPAAPWHALHRWPRPPPSWPPPHEAPTWPSYRRCLGPESSMDHGDGLINQP